MGTAIKVENLSKAYQIGQIGTGTVSRDLERWWLTKVRGKEDPFLKIGEANDRAIKGESDIVWSLKDINFEIQQGDTVGIIGRNGAGKSTLLKILSEVTSPTTGRINVKGRIASLLEVGTGFHPELSGRENIFLNGAILGMTKKEIQRKFDEIVDFAGVERYIDTPVKRYSSGMYVRLAFGIAAHLEPEILIVDEVLAVGDIEFQKKAIGKMKDVSDNQGRTVLFVSHNMASLRSLCSKGLLMMNGEIISQGPMNATISEYENLTRTSIDAIWFNEHDRLNPIFLDSIRILGRDLQQRSDFISSEDIIVEMNVVVKEEFEHVKLGFDLIKNSEVAFRSQQVDTSNKTTFQKGNHTFHCMIPGNMLNEGTYAINPLMSIHCVSNLLTPDSTQVVFNVQLDTSVTEYHGILNENNHPGIIYPFLQWKNQESLT
jgi:lipopolysaccharide transport system ATP-binding protein